jgi:hypothetical protein
MSTVGIVALSILAALFLFALFSGVGLLVWLAWNQKKQQAAAEKENARVHAETEKVLAANQAEVKALLESAKAGFGSIRNETRATLESYQKTIGVLLEDHRREMQAGIEKINAEALTSVAVRLTNVCIRTEKAIGVLQQIMMQADAAPAFTGGPEDYGPEEGASTFGGPPTAYSVSRTAQMDEEVEREQSVEMFTEHAEV